MKSPFFGLFMREVRRYLKVPYQTLCTPLINSLLYLLIFGLSLGRNISLPGYSSYLLFLIPGLIMMTSLKNAFENAASSCLSSKYCNELVDLRVVPLTLTNIAFAKSLAALSRGLIVATLTFIVSFSIAWVSQGVILTIQYPFIFIYFLLTAGLSFGALGVAIGMWAKNFDAFNAIGSFLLTPLIYLGGVFFSLETLHPFWQTVSKFNPILYMINGMRYGLVGHSDVDLTYAILYSFACLVFFYACAFFNLRKGVNYHW